MLKWSGLVVGGLVLLLVGYSYYVVASFDTETLPAQHGRVVSELFLGSGPQQALLVGLGGSEGGNAWASERWQAQRERFLAQGYAFLAVGYFGAPGTPAQLDRIALEGVHAAIRKAAQNPQIDAACIALIGGSKGGELALSLASHYPDIKAVVGIVPGHAVFAGLTEAMTTSSFSYLGKPLPFVPVPWSATLPLLRGDLRAAFEIMLGDEAAVEKARIQAEKINGPIFLVSASADEFWPSAEMSQAMVERLRSSGFAHPVEHLVVPGAHAAPLAQFARIEAFLAQHFKSGAPEHCAR